MTSKNKIFDALRIHPYYSTRFGNNLLRTLMDLEDKDKNIAISPSRLQAVMVLLANWASPAIRNEILKCVGDDTITIDEANMLSSSKRMMATPFGHYKNEGGDFVPVIEQQTILWVQKELEVNKKALSQMAENFVMALKQVDFKDYGLKTIVDKVISEATHGLIRQLELPLTEKTIALITDILYFKAAWKTEFEKYDTKEQLFYGTKGKAKIPMMKQTHRMEYAETDKCQIVNLPYICNSKENVSFSMRIYLPKPKRTTAEVLNELKEHEFNLCTEIQKVKLSLPRFSVESSIDMNRLLKELGLSCIFESDDIIPDCIHRLQIEQVIQQTKIIVDEHGTEAAAVTSMGMLGCLPTEGLKPIVMTVNRPFLFEIAEDETNTILFTGIINNID